MSFLNLQSLIGWFALAGLAWTLGGLRRPVPWRPVIGSSLLAFGLGALVFLVPPMQRVLLLLNDVVVSLIGASQSGAVFLFGPLALNPGSSTAAGEPSVGLVLAAQVFPAVVFFSALMAVLHHLGWIAPVVRQFGRLFHRTLGLSGAEALSGAAHMFFGVETAAAVRPYLRRMTDSELLTVLTTNLATAASTTLVIYVVFLRDAFPQIAGHLLSASLLSIPCSVLAVKLMLPETAQPETAGSVPEIAESEGSENDNLLSALASGALAGLRISAGIAAILIAVLGVVALIDQVLGAATGATGWVDQEISLSWLLGIVFTPLAWLVGLGPDDVTTGGRLLGQRLVLTEIVSYQELGQLAESGSLSPRSILVLSYALCGFAHVAGMGIALGGFGALAPERLTDLGRLALRALAAATIATLLTGCIAGVFYYGQTGVLQTRKDEMPRPAATTLSSAGATTSGSWPDAPRER